jgi:thioredoxin reductase
MHDLVIIGCGPAGLSAALTAEQEGLDYVVFEKDRVLDTLQNYPQEKPVLDYPVDVKVKGPLEFKAGKASEIVSKWKKAAEGLNVKKENFEELEEKEGHFVVKGCHGSYETKNVLIAMGIQGKARCLGIPGEDQDNVFHNKMPEMDFKNKKVVVVGGGDTALECAVLCEKSGGESLVCYRKPDFFRPKKENVDALEESGADVMFESNLKEIKGNKLVIQKKEGQVEKDFDYLLICAGTQQPKEFLAKQGIELEQPREFNQEPVQVKPGLFVAGDLASKPSIKMAINQGFNTVKKIKG